VHTSITLKTVRNRLFEEGNSLIKREESPRIVCADRFYMTKKAIEALQNLGEVIWADCKNEDELVEKVRSSSAKVIISEYFKITGRVMDASPNLKGVVVWGVGFDHIDIHAASERGIYVANTRGSNAESVAEHVFALMLCLSRKLFPTFNFVKAGEWTTREESGLPGELIAQDLYEKTVGIVGLGAIGSRVARIAQGFNMRILTYDPYISPEMAKEKGVELVNFEKLLKESDFITLHVVLTKETRGMIGTRELNMMKPTAYLINASRGPVVNGEALIRALKDKKITGVGLDVFTKEPIDAKNPLLKFDNVILTPHCAGNSKEALEATSLMVSKEAEIILSNQVPHNLVNRRQLAERGYLS
jgi:D-3-phosphoglycerate dehydrogenase